MKITKLKHKHEIKMVAVRDSEERYVFIEGYCLGCLKKYKGVLFEV